MRFYVQYRLVCESFAFVKRLCCKLDGGVVAICLFNGLHDFVFVYIPDREDLFQKSGFRTLWCRI